MSYKNLAWFTISNTPSTSGDFTVSTAVDSLHVTLGAADDGLSFSTRILETGVGSEVRTSCLYTHSTTTLSRGTLESSTSGSALDFTSAAQVQILGATADSAQAADDAITEADRSASYGFYVGSDGTNKQTVTDATWVVLNGGSSGVLRTVEYNVGSVWSADANGRATLPAGRWLIGGCATVEAVNTGQRIFVAVSKNGSTSPAPHRLLARSGPAASSNFVGLSGSTIVESNGSDYFSLVVYVDGSGTHDVSNTANYVYFWAEYMGPVL